MNKRVDAPSTVSLHAMLDYLTEEIQLAETKEDLEFILNLARDMLTPSTMTNTIKGLGHLRAEVDQCAIARAQTKHECTVRLDVPQILSGTFQDLSSRMRKLQNEDPDTFASATSALTWLAQGELSTN